MYLCPFILFCGNVAFLLLPSVFKYMGLGQTNLLIHLEQAINQNEIFFLEAYVSLRLFASQVNSAHILPIIQKYLIIY